MSERKASDDIGWLRNSLLLLIQIAEQHVPLEHDDAVTVANIKLMLLRDEHPKPSP